MSEKIVTIEATSADPTWIQDFEQQLIEDGFDGEKINTFHRCLDQTGGNYDEASALFNRLDAQTSHKIHLLLAPHFHKHYLRNIAEISDEMSNFDTTQLVYDKSQLEDGPSSEVGTILSVDYLLNHWKELYPNRILSPEEGIEFMKTILPLRKEFQSALVRENMQNMQRSAFAFFRRK